MIELDIKRALLKAVESATAAITNPLPVQYPGVVFDPPNDNKFIEIVDLPNDATVETWSNGSAYSGTMRILLHWPIDGAGQFPALIKLLEYKTYFAKGTVFWENGNKVIITAEPRMSSLIVTDRDLLQPMNIKYSSTSTL